MSQENVEVIHRQANAVNRRNADAFAATVSPDVEWEDSVYWTEDARLWRGRAAVREWFKKIILEPWETIRAEVDEITQATEDRVFFAVLLTARGRDSGVETRQRFWAVYWITQGEVARRRVFRERAEALEAAGLSE
jgi:ketosteroid isomerase-like protein